MSACSSCRQTVRWVELDTGARMPLDPEPLPYVAAKLVAVNPATGRGHVLAEADLPRVPAWLAQGVVLHRSHFGSCPDAAQHRLTG